MTGRRMLAVLSVLVVASASSAVWAAPRSIAYHDLIQYPLACACDMHVVVSPRGDQIFVAQGTRLLTIASGLCGVLPVRTSAEDFGTPNYVSSLVTDGATCFVSTGSTLRTYQTAPCWRLNRAPTARTRLSTHYTNRSMVQVGNTLYVTGGGWFYI